MWLTSNRIHLLRYILILTFSQSTAPAWQIKLNTRSMLPHLNWQQQVSSNRKLQIYFYGVILIWLERLSNRTICEECSLFEHRHGYGQWEQMPHCILFEIINDVVVRVIRLKCNLKQQRNGMWLYVHPLRVRPIAHHTACGFPGSYAIFVLCFRNVNCRQ